METPDGDLLDRLRRLLMPTDSGSNWGTGQKEKKRKRARLPLGKETIQLGTLGPDIDRIHAQLLWLEASPSASTPKINPGDGGFTATVTSVRGSLWTFRIGLMIRCQSDRFKNLALKHAQVVLEPLVWASGRASFQQAVQSCQTGRFMFARSFGEVRTLRWNGPFEFDLDRPLDSTWPDMVVTFQKLPAR
jgi:hypothetical protein